MTGFIHRIVSVGLFLLVAGSFLTMMPALGEIADDGAAATVPDEQRPAQDARFGDESYAEAGDAGAIHAAVVLSTVLSPDLLYDPSRLLTTPSNRVRIVRASDAAPAPFVATSATRSQSFVSTPIAIMAISFGGFLLAFVGIFIRDAFLRREDAAGRRVGSSRDGSSRDGLRSAIS